MIKQISKTIQNLLLDYNYVAIPQLGGFVSNYQSARIIEDKNIILPPSKLISFNSDLKNNDGLLIHALAQQEQITLQQSEQLIKLFVKEVFIRLDEGKKIVLDRIGFLRFNQQLNIEFEFDSSENYYAHSYGMVGVSCSTLSENEIVERKKQILFTKKNFIRAAVLIPFLVVGTILSIYLNNIGMFTTYGGQQASVITVPINKKSNVVSENNNTISAQIDLKTEKKNALAYSEPMRKTVSAIKEKDVKIKCSEVVESTCNNEKETSVSEKNNKEIKSTPELKYQLIAGSFKGEANAKRLLRKIEKLNYQPIIIKKGNRFRVIASAYSNKQEAVKIKKELKQRKISTWVNTLK